MPLIGIDLETDPIASGAVKTLSQPGGNVTGVWLDMPEMAGKLVELLKEIVPDLTRCAVIWDREVGKTQLDATERAATASAVAVQDLPFVDSTDVATLLANSFGQALIVLTSPRIYFRRADIARAAAAQRIPSISLFPEYARAGGLVAYGPSLTGMFRRASRHVDQILRGKSVADLPVERPTRFELVLNAKASKDLGLTIPPTLLARADEVIE
jgi:putative tryptophan/tyrosine transport system substrate-binding protein